MLIFFLIKTKKVLGQSAGNVIISISIVVYGPSETIRDIFTLITLKIVNKDIVRSVMKIAAYFNQY
jgi:hypothetical protein